MQNNFSNLGKDVHRRTHSLWRYLTALLMILTLSIGQMWAGDPDLAIGTDGQTSSSFLGEYSTEGITLSSSASYSSGAVQLGNTPSSYDQHYFEVLSADAEIEKVSFLISGNGSNKSIQAPVFAWAETATGNTADTYVFLSAVTVTANSYAAAQWFEYDLSGANVKCARIYRTTKNISSTDPAYTGSSTALGSGQTIKIYGIKVWLKSSTCSAPTDPAISGAAAYTEGDEVSLTASATGTGTSTTYTWYKGTSWADASATSPIGADATFTIASCTTADEGTYWCNISNGTGCDVQVSQAIAVGSAAPVCPSGLTISGTAAYTEGETIELTGHMGGGNGTIVYHWYKDAIDPMNEVGTPGNDVLNIAACTASDAGNYYFVAVKSGCPDMASDPFAVTVSAPILVSSIALDYDEQHIYVGDVITITPTILPATASNKTLLWSVTSGASITQAGVLTAEAASDVQVTAEATDGSGVYGTSHIYIDALPVCASLTPATSGSAINAGDVIDLQETAPNGSITALSANLSYTSYGLQFGTNSGTKAQVALNNLMQPGTIISVTLIANGTGARGLKLYNAAGSTQVASLGWSSATNGEEATFTYTVTASDQLNGTNGFQLWRNNTVTLKELTVANCGAELLALTSAVDPIGEATVTLSANQVLAGGSATATYTIADPTAYDFDEWVISSGDAVIADAHAATAAITMGTTAATITLKLKAAGTKYTVTYYDGAEDPTNKLGEELVEEANTPTGAGLAPRKLGYSFAGWSTTNGGAVVALTDIFVAANMPLFAVWNAIDCSAESGSIYSMNITVPPAQNCTIKTASGFESTLDLFPYGGIVGGEAMLSNTGSSNNCILQSDGKIVLKDNVSCLKLDFNCPLAEGDKILSSISGNTAWVSADATRPSGTSTALAVLASSATGEFVIPAASDLIGEQTIYLWKGGGNTTITSVNIYRPAHFAVTFNMHDHGDAVDPQYIVEGGKVAEPADPTASGWDFGGWYTDDTYGTAWDFANMTISAATEIHAQWTVHTTSTDASLSDLQVNGVTVPSFSSTVTYYNVELPMGTAATDIPTVSATTHDANAEITQIDYPVTLPGTAMVTVRAEDGTTVEYYTIVFTIATTLDINLVFKAGTAPCKGTPDMSTQILSNNPAVSTYINQITFTNVEGTGDDGSEGSSLNVGKKAGNMFTLTAKPGYAFEQMHFLAKIQDATCEYSLDGGAWTELTSLSTSTDECYAPFASGTVHEFRLRSTGALGVWIRNMQLAIKEACMPVAITWDAEPVEFEVGKAGQEIAATANTGDDVAYGSSDNLIIAVDAVNGTLSVSDLGSVTLSASTAEGDGTTYCENGGADIVINKVVNTYYLVTLDAGNGDAATEIKYYSGDAAIAQPVDPIYAGHTFNGWLDESAAPVVWPLTPTASTALQASWTVDCTAPTIDVQPASDNYLTGRTATALNCEATAAGSGTLNYAWYSCDDDLKTNPVALSGAPTPSTAAAGTFYYFCEVTEEGCANIAYSDVATIVVTDKDPICLAWVDVTGQNAVSLDATKSLYAPAVSAECIKNSSTYETRTGWKFNSAPGYIAIEGAPFKSGDIVEMFVTSTTADKARVFNANEAIDANIVAEGAANMVQGANRVALTADANNLYLRRGEDHGGWNPYVAYVAVYRACAPILNSVTVAGVDGTPDNTNHVAVEVPASTDVAALSAIAYNWISNDASWTAAHDPVVANAWEFGVENTVTFTDKDGDASVYYITISKAAASSDASLSALTVNGQAVALVPGQYSYDVELPYGTSVAPTVLATANHIAATATVDPCTLTGATITVVPESGAGDQQVYTLNFTVSAWKEIVIWDGSYMDAVETSPDATGLAWGITGFGSITNYNATCGAKAYTKNLPSGGSASSSRNFVLNVPAGYVAKFYVAVATHSNGSERGMFIGSNLTKTEDATSVLSLSNSVQNEAVAGMSEVVGAGTYYINPTASVDFYEIRAYLRPGFARTDMVGNGVLGTICVDHNVAVADIIGASVYELAGKQTNGKLAFDELVSGQMGAGVPHVFQAHGDRVVFYYGSETVTDPVNANGIYGTFTDLVLSGSDLNDTYYFAQKALWGCSDLSSLNVPANRAYVKYSEVPDATPAPAPGRRRIVMEVYGKNMPTDVENVQGDNVQSTKLLINGQLFILRGEKLYDATGRLVK